jgi:hypothetical protein
MITDVKAGSPHHASCSHTTSRDAEGLHLDPCDLRCQHSRVDANGSSCPCSVWGRCLSAEAACALLGQHADMSGRAFTVAERPDLTGNEPDGHRR